MPKPTYLCRKCGGSVDTTNAGQIMFGGVLCRYCTNKGWKLVDGQLVDGDGAAAPPKSDKYTGSGEYAGKVAPPAIGDEELGPLDPAGAPVPIVERPVSSAVSILEEVAAEREVKLAVPEPVAPFDPELAERQRLVREEQEWRRTRVYEVPPDLGRMAQAVVVRAFDAIATDDREKWQEAGRHLEWLGLTIKYNGGSGYLRLDDPYVPARELRAALFGPLPKTRRKKSA